MLELFPHGVFFLQLLLYFLVRSCGGVGVIGVVSGVGIVDCSAVTCRCDIQITNIAIYRMLIGQSLVQCIRVYRHNHTVYTAVVQCVVTVLHISSVGGSGNDRSVVCTYIPGLACAAII